MSKRQPTPQDAKFGEMVLELINQAKTPRGTIDDACKIVAQKIGCNHKTALIVAHGGYIGKELQERIRQVYNTGELIIPPTRWGCITDFDNEEDLRKVQKLSMNTRRRALLDAAEGE